MKKIKIIHTNDIHSSFNNLLRMVSVIKQEKDENTLLLDGGDFNDFSSLITKGTNGYAGLKLLSTLGYSAVAIGNNEGFQKVKTIEKMCSYNLLELLSCNVLKESGEEINGLKKYIIKGIDGVRFLIIGASPYLPSYNKYYNCYGLKAIEPFAVVRNIIKENKGEYDFIILLSHLGLKTDIMMSQSVPNIDIIIGGHSHHVFNCVKVNNTYIHQSGFMGSHVGVVDFYIKDNKIVDFNDKNIEINGAVPIDSEALSFLKEQEDLSKSNLKTIVCKAKESLSYSVDKECNFTNLLCDYLYNKYKCDFSLVNSGMTENNIAKGKVGFEDILLTCNSPSIICNIKIKGKHIIKAIIESSDSDKCFYNKRMIGFRGSFLGKLHVSYNCRIDKNNILYINNTKIENDQYYNIITVDLLSRGEGYKALKRNKECEFYKETIQDALINAINDNNNYEYINQKRWEE